MKDNQQTRVTSLVSTREEKQRAVRATAPRLPDVSFYILGLVAEYPDGIHGYGLMRAGTSALFPGQSFGLAQLYRRLERLHGRGFLHREVEASGPRLRYRFSITPRGLTVLERWLASPAMTAEGVMARLRFAHRLPRTAVREMLQAAERRTTEALTAFRNSAEYQQRAQAGDGLWIRAVEARLDAERQWLEAVITCVSAPTSDLGAAGAATSAAGGI